MHRFRQHAVLATCVTLTLVSLACSATSGEPAEVVVAQFFENVYTGDADAIDPLFFRIAEIEADEAAWLALIDRVVQQVADDQSKWNIVCSRELSTAAVVVVNQTRKAGKPHGDLDAVFLVKQDGHWRMLPDTIAPNAKRVVAAAMSQAQASELFELQGWSSRAILGQESDCKRQDPRPE